jgi:hypothetical protein
MTYLYESSDGPLDVGVSPIFIRSCFLTLIHHTSMEVVCPSELVVATAKLVDVVLTFCVAPDLQKIRKFF